MREGRTLVGRYRLASKLGSGAMGSVWRAWDLKLNADVAVKLIDPRYAASPEALARFRREAQAAAAIRSTYVVQILDHGIDEDTPFIAMELLHGESLAQRLAHVGRLSPESTGRLLSQVARALSLAHEHGIVHRDLKPDNIFLVHEGDEDIGKVLDFGVARSHTLNDSVGLATETGAVLGTPYYMSPEQAAGKPLDWLTDIWSFAIIACECVTGRRPYVADSLPALFHAICMGPEVTPSMLGPVPAGFDAWFARGAARDKDRRFQSIRQAAEELRGVCLGASDSRPASGREPRSADVAPTRSLEPKAVDAHTVTSLQFNYPSSGTALLEKPRAGANRGSLLVAFGVLSVGLFVGVRTVLKTGERGEAPLSAAANSASTSERAPAAAAVAPTEVAATPPAVVAAAPATEAVPKDPAAAAEPRVDLAPPDSAPPDSAPLEAAVAMARRSPAKLGDSTGAPAGPGAPGAPAGPGAPGAPAGPGAPAAGAPATAAAGLAANSSVVAAKPASPRPATAVKASAPTKPAAPAAATTSMPRSAPTGTTPSSPAPPKRDDNAAGI
ncbi:MAG: serine/threonine-protein kinase [Myxococcota bacterium]